jgi:hypothetical protein
MTPVYDQALESSRPRALSRVLQVLAVFLGWLAFASALILEVVGLTVLTAGLHNLQSQFFLLHGSAALLFSGYLVLSTRTVTAESVGLKVLCGLLTILLLPGIGMMAWMVLAPFSSRKPKQAAPPRWRHIATRPLAEVPAPHHLGGITAADVTGILSGCGKPERRKKAVMSLSRFSNEVSIPLLRTALQDPEDDVRLLAFAILDRKQKYMDEKIALGRVLRESSENLAAHRLLAVYYWEQAYLGLAQPDFIDYLLACSLEHLDGALSENRQDAGLLLLLARILIRQGELSRGRRALLQARRFGIRDQTLRPYFDEIAFRESRRSYLDEIAFLESRRFTMPKRVMGHLAKPAQSPASQGAGA